MANASETQAAIYDAVIQLLVKAESSSGTIRSTMVRDAGVAYRAARGGPQPGGVHVETK